MTDMDYPSNSHSKKDEETRPALKQITNKPAVEKQPSLSKRIAQSFVGDDTHSVGSYVLFDVLIPAAKSTISDMISQGIERLLFGSGRVHPSANSSYGRGSYTSYSLAKPPAAPSRTPGAPAPQSNARSYKEIVVETRQEAEEVIQALMDPLDQYGWVSVGDLYSLVGIVASFQDQKWGWDNLAGASYRRIPQGYLLEFPKAVYQE